MIELRQILCPLDLSENSAAVYGYATMLSRWYQARITALEMIWVGIPSVRSANSPLVLTTGQLEEFKGELDAFIKAHTPTEVPVHTILREGPVDAGILDEARRMPADLIVMGTHGRRGWDRFVMGSVAEKVLRLAECPVMTIPGSAAPAQSPRPFSTILCAIDFSPASVKALRYALSLAQESGKRLVLVHVFDLPVDRPVTAGLGPELSAIRRAHDEAALRELRSLVPDEARLWCECREVTAIGRPYEEILTLAQSEHADLIVMGVHSRNAVERALFGSTAAQVVRYAACPVLTLRP